MKIYVHDMRNVAVSQKNTLINWNPKIAIH